MPFVIDPTGRFAAEVQADYTLGERIGLIHTPTIFVLAPEGLDPGDGRHAALHDHRPALAETPAADAQRKHAAEDAQRRSPSNIRKPRRQWTLKYGSRSEYRSPNR